MRRAARRLAVGFVLSVGGMFAPTLGVAQDTGAAAAPGDLRAPIVTLDRERLFAESMMGKALQAQLEEASAALIAENRRLEAALEEEELALTAQRATMPAEEFRKLAAEFDSRVEALRNAQDTKSRGLTRQRDENRQKLFDAAIPVLGALMVDIQAVAIIERSAIILTFDQLDITEQAIARMDATLGAGEGAAPAPEPEPAQPDPAAPQE